MFLFANSQYRSTHFCACPVMSWDHAITSALVLPESRNFSVAPLEIRHSNIISVVVDETVVRFTLALSATQVHLIKKRRRLLQMNMFYFLNVDSKSCFLPAILISSTYSDRN